MKVFIQGVLKIVENSAFKDATTGAKVPYFTNYVQDPEGKLSKIGSSEDFSEFIDEPVVAECEMRPDFNKPNLFRVKVTSVRKEK